MRWMFVALALAAGCRTPPLVLIERDGAPDLAAPDLAGADFAGVDFAHADLARVDLTPNLSGCADGTREGFPDEQNFPNIAGCSGGFWVPGVLSATRAPRCGRAAGNDSPNPSGVGCDVEDLCEEGWHVCASASDVALHSPSGCAGAAPSGALFFVTRQSSNGCRICATGTNTADPPCDGQSCVAGCAQSDATANDIFGCGSLGGAPDAPTCGVLDRFGNNLCMDLPPDWACGVAPDPGLTEAEEVVHTGPDHGGALCCRN
jgi:hypothetical protein